VHVAYSLACSYLLLGTAIGLVVWLAAGRITNKEDFAASSQKVIPVALVLAVLGVGFAVAHLGQMGRFINLMSNPHSWLSREGFFAGGFTVLTLLYFLLAKKGPSGTKNLDALLYLAALAGSLTLVSMGMIYATVKAVPAWNTTLVVLADIFSGLLTGGFLFLVLTGNNLSPSGFRPMAIALFVTAIFSTMINLAYEAQVGMVLSALASQGASVPSTWLGATIRIVIGLLVPMYFIARYLKEGVSGKLSGNLAISLVCVIVGEVAAKMMHFVVAVKGPLF
jgi:DMSO reductase anchor subunit